jgi:hypothetical protein
MSITVPYLLQFYITGSLECILLNSNKPILSYPVYTFTIEKLPLLFYHSIHFIFTITLNIKFW